MQNVIPMNVNMTTSDRFIFKTLRLFMEEKLTNHIYPLIAHQNSFNSDGRYLL